jgi:hypothetical protein
MKTDIPQGGGWMRIEFVQQRVAQLRMAWRDTCIHFASNSFAIPPLNYADQSF